MSAGPDIIRRLLALLLALACAPPAPPPPPPDIARALARRYDELLPPGATVGACVISLGSGRTVFARDDTLPLIPASTQKLLVAGLALTGWDATWDSLVSDRLARSRDRDHRFLRDPKKLDSLALLLEAPDVDSWPLSRRLLAWTCRHSDNAAANWLLAAARRARPDSLYCAWLDSLGVPTGGLQMTDGSGLSRANRVTARTLARLLAALRDARGRELFFLLPEPGHRGTLLRRGLGVGHRARAKTGYIREVFTLAGYLSAENDTFAFAFLANDCPDPRAAYRLFSGLLLAAYRADAADTLPATKSTGAAEPPR